MKSTLVDAGREKKPSEFRERFFPQRARPVKIVAAWQVAIREQILVLLDISGQPPRNRPNGPGIQYVQKNGVGHQPRHTAVAVEEWMHPEQTVVCCCRRNN
jgi:hypothetical protein